MSKSLFLWRRESTEKAAQKRVLRELYRFLELDPSQWSRWSRMNIVENPFAAEKEDWEVFLQEKENPSGGRPSANYVLSLTFAKKLAMMSKSAKAEQIRDYFIECERQVFAPKVSLDFSDPLTAARLYIEAETAKRAAERQLEDQAPAVAFARKVEMSAAEISVGAFAKSIGWGPNKLHDKLRRLGFMYRQDGHPLPKQRYVEQGLFEVKQVPVGSRTFPVTTITGKGQLRLARALGFTLQQSLALTA